MNLLRNETYKFITTHYNSLLLSLVWVIYSDYAKYTSAPLTISQYATNKESLQYQTDIINAVLRKLSHLQNTANVSRLIKFQFENSFELENNTEFREDVHKRITAIWFLDSFNAFEYLEKDLLNEHKYYHRNGWFTMVYQGLEANPLRTLKKIFSRLFDLYVLNINVILPGITSHVYTYIPFQPNGCRSPEPKLILTIKDEVPADDFRFFKSKLSNLYGCPIVLTSWNQEPFVFVKYNNITGKVQDLYGTEGSIVTLMSNRMNFSMQISNPPTPDRGELLQNGTMTGVLKMVVDGLTNLTMNSYQYDKVRTDYMLAVNSHMSVDSILVIPKGEPMSSWERLTKAFKPKVWFILCATIIFATAFIFCLKCWASNDVKHFVFGRGNHTPFTNLLAVLYGMGLSKQLPKRNFSRFILTVWILYTFILRSAYLSELFYILQDVRTRKTVSTLAEVVQQNYTIYATSFTNHLIAKAYPNANFVNIDGVKETIQSRLRQLMFTNEPFAVGALEQTIKLFNQHEMRFGRRVYTLPERVLTAPLTFYMRKHSYLEHSFKDQILDFLAFGIIQKFEKYYFYAATKPPHYSYMAPLNIDVFQTIFKIYFMLLFSCLLIFILELQASKFTKLHAIFNIFNC